MLGTMSRFWSKSWSLAALHGSRKRRRRMRGEVGSGGGGRLGSGGRCGAGWWLRGWLRTGFNEFLGQQWGGSSSGGCGGEWWCQSCTAPEVTVVEMVCVVDDDGVVMEFVWWRRLLMDGHCHCLWRERSMISKAVILKPLKVAIAVPFLFYWNSRKVNL